MLFRIQSFSAWLLLWIRAPRDRPRRDSLLQPSTPQNPSALALYGDLIIINNTFTNSPGAVAVTGDHNTTSVHTVVVCLTNEQYIQLGNELLLLRDAMMQRINNNEPGMVDRLRETTAMDHAQQAANEKHGSALMGWLSKGGKFAFQTAKDIGVALAASYLEKASRGGAPI